MEKEKKSKRKAAKTGKGFIVQAYKEYVLTEGKRPTSVYKFCVDLGIKEEEFYQQYGSFDALEKSIWRAYISEAAALLNGDPNYETFSAREKVLSFHFTLAELLKKNRSFILVQLSRWNQPGNPPSFLKGAKQEFDAWITPILEAGKNSGEVASRPFADKQHPVLFWFHLLFLVHFWVRDESPGFEHTDVAIEKSTNLAFELMGKGVFEQTFDFAKFLFQQLKA